jgi:Tol biopolymer transport system component
MLIIIISLVSTFGLNGCRATKNKIAFVSDRDGDLEIYIMNVDGSDQMQLTYDESNDTIGSFSN